MNYLSGEVISIGDHVMLERGKTPGQVVDVITVESQIRQLKVEEPGVMIKSAPFGLVFWPLASDDPLVFVSRGAVD